MPNLLNGVRLRPHARVNVRVFRLVPELPNMAANTLHLRRWRRANFGPLSVA